MIPSSYQPIGTDSPSENDDNSSLQQDTADAQQPQWRQVIRRLQKADKSFLVSKAFYFFFYTALGALFPFFSLFYKQLWLTPGQIGLLLALRPIVKLVCLPLWKMVTDRYSKPKVVYFISILGWLIGYFGQSFVYPTTVPCYEYAVTPVASRTSGVSANFGHVNSSAKFTHNLTTRQLTRELALDSEFFRSLKKRNVENYRNLLRTKEKERLGTNELHVRNQLSNMKEEAPFFMRSQVSDPETTNEQDMNMKSSSDSSNQPAQESSRVQSEEKHSEEEISSLINDGGQEKETLGEHGKKSKQIREIDFQEGKSITRKTRSGIEPFEIGKEMHESPKPANDFRVEYNFWIFRTLIIIVVLTEIITTPTPMLADSAIVQALVDSDSEYGKQRLFGSLGLSLAAILVAVWVTFITDCVYTDTINYLPCFYVFEIALGATVLVSLFVKFDRPHNERESQYGFLQGLKLFKSFQNGVFLVTLFLFGFLHSLQTSFLFWFLQDLGGTPVLVCTILLIYCLAEVVMYFLSGAVVEAIGQQGILWLASACYTARFLMYTYLKDPWLVLPMEIVQGVTYGGVWSIAAVYVNAPPEATSMVQSILHGSYWGLGMAFGAGISGVAIDYTGPRSVFLFMSGFCFLLSIFHLGIDIYNKIKTLEESHERKRAARRGETKLSKAKEDRFIGAAAAPLVPCLLYAR